MAENDVDVCTWCNAESFFENDYFTFTAAGTENPFETDYCCYIDKETTDNKNTDKYSKNICDDSETLVETG